jgi:hypothetical protein
MGKKRVHPDDDDLSGLSVARPRLAQVESDGDDEDDDKVAKVSPMKGTY